MAGDIELPPPFPRAASSAVEPQHLLLTVLGDYWFGRTEGVPSAALVDLLAEFGASESAARQAVRRLAVRGLLVQSKHGRSTSYARPPMTEEISRARMQRAMRFGAHSPDWDGWWTVVSFSVPERERDVRRQLRAGLRQLHFGLLYDANWITPHDRVAEATELLDRLGIDAGVVMKARPQLRDGQSISYVDAFELGDLAAEYHRFIERYGSAAPDARDGRFAPADALVLRTTLMSEWLSFRITDPELPDELLPDDWPRHRAREVFVEVYDALAEIAAVRVRQILDRHAPGLAAGVSFHLARDAG
ncbi:PaaX family transcriptional regulator C-terminal domain-containing protein [Agromyces sp. NPDC049794]|uniref:PaaX family transcriptional regulator n=1 Tax=unclassified Agromyces TaxID=2639701 RepID=UPI0033D40AA2